MIFSMGYPRFFLNIFALDFLVVLTADALIAPWSFNPLYDFFILQVQGPFFSGVHVSSLLAMCLVIWFKAVKNWRALEPARWMVVIFCTASIHEFAIFFWNILLKGNNGCNCFQDVFWYAGFLILGILVASPRQRKAILGIGGITVLLMFAYVQYFNNSELESLATGTRFIWDTLVEESGWFFIALAWLFVE